MRSSLGAERCINENFDFFLNQTSRSAVFGGFRICLTEPDFESGPKLLDGRRRNLSIPGEIMGATSHRNRDAFGRGLASVYLLKSS